MHERLRQLFGAMHHLPRARLGKTKSHGAAYNDKIRSQKQQRDQKISFPMIAQRDSERESGEKTDDVRDVSDVRVIAGYPALLVDNDDIVDEVEDRDQSLRREE